MTMGTEMALESLVLLLIYTDWKPMNSLLVCCVGEALNLIGRANHFDLLSVCTYGRKVATYINVLFLGTFPVCLFFADAFHPQLLKKPGT